MELTLSQFSAWSDHLNASQLQVLITIHLLKSSNAQEIIKITQTSKRNVNRIIKQLEKLNLIRVRREPVIEPVTHLAEDGQNWPKNAAFVPRRTNLAQDDRNCPGDAAFVPGWPNVTHDGQENRDIYIGVSSVAEVPNLAQHGQNGPTDAAFVPRMQEPSEPLKSDEPNGNQAENEAKNPASLTLQAIQAALPNLNLKNTNIKELNIDLIPEDPIYTHAHAFPASASVRVCVSEGEERQESPEPKTVTVSAVAVLEAPPTHPEKNDQSPEQISPDSGHISPASPSNSALNTFGCPDYYRKFEERFETKTLPIWRHGPGTGGIKPGFVEFIRKTLDKMGGEHTRGDAIIYIDRREKASDFVTLNARAQDWLDEEKKRNQNELERKKKMNTNIFSEDGKSIDVSDVQAQINVHLIRLNWTKKDALKYMVEHHDWVENIIIREGRFDRLTDEDLIALLLKLRDVDNA
ncbi:helix-turn-helix domain-containing protein [Synechococcus sp. PCC 6312]|uniref:MarR family transcriptional regulator n=1 Tax=Synechococcus sp. (strain ATCC 27167 / PCC 6312) TaxID=195253 RepID=UPI00029EEEB7|nr:helix-turn-helix domain-containing protein [Synechococcus sp. PCC 6312]AFY61830.1 transcriptional regulator [Synechococcus sp. PCC 6312]